jgi:hypothetical protein
MKIIQIFGLLISLASFSCDKTQTNDNDQSERKRKEDSLNRVHFLAHCDSIDKMYAAIRIPRSWTIVQPENNKDTIFVYKRIHIDISTAHQVDLICFPENGQTEIFNIKSVTENVDSITFNTTKNFTNERMLWVLKINDEAQISGQWSAYNLDKKKFVGVRQYHSLNDE